MMIIRFGKLKSDQEFINQTREENLRNGRLLNAGFPIVEETAEIINLHRHGWTTRNRKIFST